MEERIEVAPLRLKVALKGLAVIYGVAIVTNFLLNAWMKAAPIGPWVGEDVLKWYWFDNVVYMVLSLWWCFLFVAVGMWPFSKIENRFQRGIVATVTCWVLGWFSYKAIYWLGLDAGWAFPIVGCIYFALVFLAYTGENWLVAGFSAPRQLGILLVICLGLTWVLTMTYVRWIPPWWFPFSQMGLATGLFSYWFRKMRQPMKGISMWLLMFIAVAVWLGISARLGLWDYKLEGIGKFWNIGSYTPDNEWLLLFMVSCSFIYGVLVPLHNWPFTKIRMPWGGILASVSTGVLAIIITVLIKNLVGTVFSSMNSALTYGYMATAWSFFITLFFGVGSEEPYLWTGQKTPGTWEDVD
ncbi:MAG: hypothetical protein P4L55_05180 [Syntrophobacteraceae bacterium]|nr:hypothetical protein [Syntrophobacteraceae bacterium]